MSGPVLQPGSSSHTAGAMQGMADDLLKAPLKSIRVVLNRNGSFAGTFGLMNKDLGMLAGAYSLLPDDEKLFDIKRIQKEKDVPFEFEFSELAESRDPNAVKFVLTGTAGRFRWRGSPRGAAWWKPCGSWASPAASGEALLLSVRDEADGPDAELAEYPGAECFRIRPLLPVVTTRYKKKQLFDAFTDWIRISKERGQGLAETAVDYEQDASGWTRAEIVAYMKRIRETMEKQTTAVYEDDSEILENPFSGYHYRKWQEYRKDGSPLAGDTVGRALSYAFAVQALMCGVKMVPGRWGRAADSGIPLSGPSKKRGISPGKRCSAGCSLPPGSARFVPPEPGPRAK